MGYDLHVKAAAIVRDAGGRLVGRTRLQKVAYLAQLAGFGDDFKFEYHHYGPYSEELAEAMEIAVGLDFVDKKEKVSASGAWYSVYTADPADPDNSRAHFIAEASKIGAIELELAATAAFLYAEEGCHGDPEGDPWEITAQRKSSKATKTRLRMAKIRYRKLLNIAQPGTLPPIA